MRKSGQQKGLQRVAASQAYPDASQLRCVVAGATAALLPVRPGATRSVHSWARPPGRPVVPRHDKRYVAGMPSFQAALDARFPGALDEYVFVGRSYDALTKYGFTSENSIACVGVCRDELCRSLVWAARDVWGEAFNFSSLGGMLTLGTSGFMAAHYHAPVLEGRERYVYIVMPHIGISAEGALGTCLRAGRHGSSLACGALNAVLGEVRAGALDLRFDPDNIEYSLLKQLLAPRLSGDDVADIAALTISMADLVHKELTRKISLTVDPKLADYAVLTGVQIHRPFEGSMVWPDRKYVCVRGEQHQLDF